MTPSGGDSGEGEGMSSLQMGWKKGKIRDGDGSCGFDSMRIACVFLTMRIAYSLYLCFYFGFTSMYSFPQILFHLVHHSFFVQFIAIF